MSQLGTFEGEIDVSRQNGREVGQNQRGDCDARDDIKNWLQKTLLVIDVVLLSDDGQIFPKLLEEAENGVELDELNTKRFR